MTIIREIDVERDASDQVELIREINPLAVITVPSWLHRMTSTPERADARAWVAEANGRSVGRVECFRNFFTEGSRNGVLSVAVRSSHRRMGIGTTLYELGLAHARTLELGALLSSFHENDAGIAFATKHGFRLVRAEAEAAIDPRAVHEPAPADVDLRPVSSVDPHLVYAVDLEATLDMPQTETIDHIPYDEWVDHVLRHPGFTTEGSFVAMVDDVAAAVSMLLVDLDSGRAVSMFTGTLRAYRGRGLALAVKLASIHWATEHGITVLATTNDETNTAMLAINRRLGYVPAGRRVEWLKELEGTAASPAPPAPAT
jgi:GNAT superfamily N-acetyltransferase